ncbi:MAG: glycosyltransferase family 2 protein [Candidatus Competibacter sp.]|nr:glycosyltransferase family 2 protein [Candidatus Competibacter sp.]
MALATPPIPLTAIVLTQDEAINIEPCLRAMARIDDIVIVDSGSTDNTLDLARTVRPDARIFHHPFQDFGDQRNWALDCTEPRHPWILFVDADEYCDPELLDEIAAFIRNPGSMVGGFIAGRNYFLGRWLKYSTMYPSYQLRLLRHGQVRYRKEGHGQREVTDGPLCYFHAGWRHEGLSKGVAQWIARHNRYSTDEVALILRLRGESLSWRELIDRDPIMRRRALKRVGAKLPFRPLTRFLYAYGIRKGFLDGYPGLLYGLLRVAHDIHITVKLGEQRYLAQLKKR